MVAHTADNTSVNLCVQISQWSWPVVQIPYHIFLYPRYHGGVKIVGRPSEWLLMTLKDFHQYMYFTYSATKSI